MTGLSLAGVAAGAAAGGWMIRRFQAGQTGRAVLSGWASRGVSFYPMWAASHEVWQLAQTQSWYGIDDYDESDGGWRLSRMVGRHALAAGLRPAVARDWAAAGFLRFEHAAAGSWPGPNGLAAWVPLGRAAPLWRLAGYTAQEAARLLALPPAHPDRPSPADLAVQAALSDLPRAGQPNDPNP